VGPRRPGDMTSQFACPLWRRTLVPSRKSGLHDSEAEVCQLRGHQPPPHSCAKILGDHEIPRQRLMVRFILLRECLVQEHAHSGVTANYCRVWKCTCSSLIRADDLLDLNSASCLRLPIRTGTSFLPVHTEAEGGTW
jgi:hypothetical protein